MIRLDTVTRKLQIVLGGAVTTNELPVTVCYSDKTATSYNGATQLSLTSGATPVDVCDAPAAATIRDVDYLSVLNRDTVAATVTISVDSSGTDYQLITTTLAAGEQLVFTHSDGWKVVDSTGQTKVTFGSGGGGVAISASGGSQATGTVVFSNSNGITFGYNAGTITATVVPGAAAGIAAISAGTQQQTSGTLNFANSNGLTWGLSGSSQITASHNGLTTAAQSNHSHGNPTLALTNLNGTTNSNSAGLTLSLSAAAQSVQTQNLVSVLGSTGNISFANSNGITFGGNASTLTASHDGFPSAQTTKFAGTGTSATNASVTLNSNGLAISVGVGGAADGYNSAQFTNSTANSTMPLVWAGNSGGSGNITVGLTGSTVTMSAPAAGAGGATVNGSTGNVSLTVASSLSMSTNGSTISFGLASNITTALQSAGAYLTTAMQSNEPHIRAVIASDGTFTSGTIVLTGSNGITVRTVGAQSIVVEHDGHHLDALLPSGNGYGTGFSSMSSGTVGLNFVGAISGSQNGNNLSISVPAQSVQTQNLVSINGSTGAVSLTVASSLSFSSNGSTISFGLASNITTALQAAGAYLTTARASTDAAGLNTALTAGPLAWTVNSSGISLNAGSAAGTTSGFAGNQISGSVTHNTAGLNISLNHPAWLTTAAQSGHSHGNPTLALTNLTGTTASASNGFTLSLSAGAPGGGVTPVASASNGSFSFTTIGFSNANNVTFGTSAGSIITASVAAPGAAAEANAIALLGANTSGNTTATGSTIGWSGINLTLSGTNASQVVVSAPATSSLVGVNGISISSNGSTISLSGVPTYTLLTFQNRQLGASSSVNSLGGQNSLWLAPARVVNPVSASTILAAMISYSGTITSAATAQAGQTLRVGIWSQHTDPASTSRFDTWWTGGASLTFWNSGTSSVSYNYSLTGGNTTGSSAGSNLMTANVMGVRQIIMPIGSSMSPGLYVFGILNSSSSAGYSAAMSRMALYMDSPASIGMGTIGQATNASVGYVDGGIYTTTTGGLPATIALNQIQGVNNVMPFFKVGAI